MPVLYLKVQIFLEEGCLVLYFKLYLDSGQSTPYPLKDCLCLSGPSVPGRLSVQREPRYPGYLFWLGSNRAAMNESCPISLHKSSVFIAERSSVKACRSDASRRNKYTVPRPGRVTVVPELPALQTPRFPPARSVVVRYCI